MPDTIDREVLYQILCTVQSMYLEMTAKRGRVPRSALRQRAALERDFMDVLSYVQSPATYSQLGLMSLAVAKSHALCRDLQYVGLNPNDAGQLRAMLALSLPPDPRKGWEPR